MDEIIQRIILENQEMIQHKLLVDREYHIPDTEHITVLTGIQRCGKTHILYQLAKKYNNQSILFLDFEDERLIGLNSLENYDCIIDAYKTIYTEAEPILFFDEIQNLKNWHLYLKRLHVKGYKLYVTGSNANLISREIATYLKGRSLETTIYPFSFKEFLTMKKVKITSKDKIVNQPKIIKYYNEYLKFGGFPEVIKANDSDKRTVAKNIFNLLFYKDLVSKYDKNDYLLKLVINKIVENLTKEFSITSLAKKISSIYKTSVPTVNEYFNILPEPYLTYNIHQFRHSFIQRESKRKTYLADNSFIFLNRVDHDLSRLFENLVFNFLIRKFDTVNYYKMATKEVDFCIITNSSPKLIQVSYSLLNDDTKAREVNSLIKAMEEFNCNEAFIYTHNESEKIEIGAKTIYVLPFWQVSLAD